MNDLKKRVARKQADWNLIRRKVAEDKDLLAVAEARVVDITEAQEFTQTIAQEIQQKAHARIAAVVSQCLEAVFDEPYAFKIHFEQKRGRTEASLVFERNGMEVDPLTASGGGVVDVAAFALRLSCLMLSRPPMRRLVVLDEPFKFVSEEFRGRVREMLNRLSQELGVQIIMLTHIPELETGKVIRLGEQ